MSSSSVPLPGTKSAPKIYILDSSALLRFLDQEAGYERVRRLLREYQLGICKSVMTSLYWGEIALKLVRRHGDTMLPSLLANVETLGLQIIPATAERAVRSARIQARLKIPYVDAFGVELAAESQNHIFVTADFDLKPAANEVNIEFLPVK